MSESFRQTLEHIAQVVQQHPEYLFEGIAAYTRRLQNGEPVAAWIDEIVQQWQELSAPRQEACQQIFDYALLRARQATYRPVNALDQFLENQLYGIQDGEVVQKSAVSQALRQLDEQVRKRPPAPAGRTAPVAGRTNPLNPRQLPGNRPPEL
ncbi:MAG: hypothetical protein ACO1RX_09135 [Candidatus Sericytochromatia bacterium]